MCASGMNIGDPLGLLKYKWADPLGLTKTKIGDPLNLTGQRTPVEKEAALPPAPQYLPSEYVRQAGSAMSSPSTQTTTQRRARTLYGTPMPQTQASPTSLAYTGTYLGT